MQSDFVKPLLLWYNDHARDLPWRQTRDPYRIWVSEIMLQQTRVEAVKVYYDRFLEALPDIRALAEVPEERLLKLWEGLGYYNRVRNMQRAACMIRDEFQGEFPDTEEAVLSLPGIGSYTAGAVLSIAFGVPLPAVDGNVLRVMSRLTASYDDIAKPAVRKALESELRTLLTENENTAPGLFNQAVMELGATICGPNRSPDCAACPISSFCRAHREGIEEELPVKTGKKARRIEEITVLLIRDGEKTAIRKRQEGKLLGGFYEFPNLSGRKDQDEVRAYLNAQGLDAVHIRPLQDAKHIFTHVEWKMSGYLISLGMQGAEKAAEDLCFVETKELEQRYPLPSAFRAYAKYLFVRTGSERLRAAGHETDR
ncbi:MAG: A/G-specific adenine glycosylase [Lachnospiraceae bacterium]|nr:A/G-specific adenine glycosylase [Lachnospiraceae bacterium]